MNYLSFVTKELVCAASGRRKLEINWSEIGKRAKTVPLNETRVTGSEEQRHLAASAASTRPNRARRTAGTVCLASIGGPRQGRDKRFDNGFRGDEREGAAET